jgi:hypothetical protein
MLFLDVLNAALSLDIGYFSWLVASNIHWIFIFATIMVFFQHRKKHQLFYLLVFILMLYSVVDFAHIMGWHFPAVLQIHIVVLQIVIAACTNYKIIKKHEGILGLGGFWAIWIILSLFVW